MLRKLCCSVLLCLGSFAQGSAELSSFPNGELTCRTVEFLPTQGRLFRHFYADPRAVEMSVGWRFNDHIFAHNLIDIAMGHTIPMWRWENVWCCGDTLQLEIEGGLWGIFDHLGPEAALINTDYFIGIPVAYRRGCWTLRLRGFHVSSHIGDEFLLENPGFPRVNPSAEYLDLFAAYEPWPFARIYGGYGYIVHYDPSFAFHRNYFELGFESRIPGYHIGLPQHCIVGHPFYAMHFRLREDNHYGYDATYVLGYEFDKYTCAGSKLRFYLQYHKGCSLEGQFCRLKTDYFSLRFAYGY